MSERQSIWKKEVSFGRKPKEPKEQQPKQPKQEKQPRRKVAKAGVAGQKRLVGLKIGASQLAAATVTNNGSAELLLVARQALEPGIVVGGELRDPERLSEALKKFFAAHDLPRRNVRLGVANNRIGVRTFDIAGIEDPGQLDNAVRFRAQEALPIPIEDAVLDYHVLS
jgi:type IV pilus assembly protein PilM